MTQYENFAYLVANNLGIAETQLANDICYAFGIMVGSKGEINVIELRDIDESYEADFCISRQENPDQYVLFMRNCNKLGGDNLVLMRVSTLAYERYQIATMLADAYLTLYMNVHVREINDVRNG